MPLADNVNLLSGRHQARESLRVACGFMPENRLLSGVLVDEESPKWVRKTALMTAPMHYPRSHGVGERAFVLLLNKLGWLPQGGLVQQTFICHAAHSR